MVSLGVLGSKSVDATDVANPKFSSIIIFREHNKVSIHFFLLSSSFAWRCCCRFSDVDVVVVVVALQFSRDIGDVRQ